MSLVNDMLRDLVVLKKAYVPERHQFGESNVGYHRLLLAAYREGDAGRVRAIMLAHMHDAERHMVALEGEVANSFLLEFPGREAMRGA
jgi:DNA-binding GntR family transcriptional regulator